VETPALKKGVVRTLKKWRKRQKSKGSGRRNQDRHWPIGLREKKQYAIRTRNKNGKPKNKGGTSKKRQTKPTKSGKRGLQAGRGRSVPINQQRTAERGRHKKGLRLAKTARLCDGSGGGISDLRPSPPIRCYFEGRHHPAKTKRGREEVKRNLGLLSWRKKRRSKK